MALSYIEFNIAQNKAIKWCVEKFQTPRAKAVEFGSFYATNQPISLEDAWIKFWGFGKAKPSQYFGA